MEKFLTKIKNMSLFFKITLLITIVITIIIAVVSTIIISAFSQITKEKELETTKKAVSQLHDFAQEKYNKVYNLANMMHATQNIGDFFARVNNDKDFGFSDELINFTNNFLISVKSTDRQVSEYILVAKNGNVYSTSVSSNRVISPSFDYFEYEPIVKLMNSDANMYIYRDNTLEYLSKNTYPVISFAGKIFNPSVFPTKQVVGIYILNVPVAYFEESYNSTSADSKYNMYIKNKYDEFIYKSTKDMGYDNAATLLDNEEEVLIQNVGVSGLQIIGYLSKDALIEDTQKIRLQMITFMIISIFLLSVVTFLLLNVYNKKIKEISNQMQIISSGNFKTRIPIDTYDETGVLADNFNSMCEKLENYINLNYVAEMKRKNAELNSLQAQINPHFLYNTIESIRMKAICDGNNSLANMLSILGNMFRWNMAFDKKIVKLEEELEYIMSYLTLQNFRFDNLIEIEVNIPDSILCIGIPKLILQPILENAIIHGFANNSEGARIDISAKEVDNDIVITIADNGKGSDTDILKKVNEYINSKKEDVSQNIGLKNVNERIKLLFGEKYGLIISKNSVEGVDVIITLPVNDDWKRR